MTGGQPRFASHVVGCGIGNRVLRRAAASWRCTLQLRLTQKTFSPNVTFHNPAPPLTMISAGTLPGKVGTFKALMWLLCSRAPPGLVVTPSWAPRI